MVTIPRTTLNIPRHEMPQVKKEHHHSYFEWLERNGVAVKRTTTTARKLKATQNEFNTDKVKAMMQKVTKDNDFCMVSNDNYILDGHHRWLANYNKNPNHPVHIVKIDLPIHELLAMTKKFDHAMYRTVHESLSFKKFIMESAKRDIYDIEYGAYLHSVIVDALEAYCKENKVKSFKDLTHANKSFKTKVLGKTVNMLFGNTVVEIDGKSSKVPAVLFNMRDQKGTRLNITIPFSLNPQTSKTIGRTALYKAKDSENKTPTIEVRVSPFDVYQEYIYDPVKHDKTFLKPTLDNFVENLKSARVRSLLTHEYAHHREYYKFKGDYNSVPYMAYSDNPHEKYETDDHNLYLFQDTEFNARYNQWAEHVVRFMKERAVSRPKMVDRLLDSYEYFIKMLTPVIFDDNILSLYYHRMNDEQKKRFNRRAYKLWDHLRTSNVVTNRVDPATQKANDMGYKYIGFGRWVDEKNKVKYIKKGDKLVLVRPILDMVKWQRKK